MKIKMGTAPFDWHLLSFVARPFVARPFVARSVRGFAYAAVLIRDRQRVPIRDRQRVPVPVLLSVPMENGDSSCGAACESSRGMRANLPGLPPPSHARPGRWAGPAYADARRAGRSAWRARPA